MQTKTHKIKIDEALQLLKFSKRGEVDALIGERFGFIRHVMYKRHELEKLFKKHLKSLCLGGNITAFINHEVRLEQPQVTLFNTDPDKVREFKKKNNIL